MASSGKQLLVGRRKRTSLKAPAGEATLKESLYCSAYLPGPLNIALIVPDVKA